MPEFPFDDPPLFNLALTHAEAFVVRDALNCLGMMFDGDLQAARAYLGGRFAAVADPDEVCARLRALHDPYVREDARRLREWLQQGGEPEGPATGS